MSGRRRHFDRASAKLGELEALRGIAAIVVLLHHFMLGFTPRLHGLLYPEQYHSIFGTPLFAFVNGSAAVVVFFVLSGFVLTTGTIDKAIPGLAVVSALKRWPRLVVMVTASTTLGGAFMSLGLFHNVHVATLVPSIWLGWFYNWSNSGWSEIAQAVKEGLTTFFTGSARYNSNLWTMYYEFWGSMAALGCSFVAVLIPNDHRRLIFILMCWLFSLGLETYLASGLFAYLSPFFIGVGISAVHSKRPSASWPSWTMVLVVPLLGFLFGYHENLISGRAEGWYAAFNPLVARDPILFRVVTHSVAAAIAIFAVLRVTAARAAMSGRVGMALGFMSFGIYVSQIIVICSLTSWTYEMLHAASHPVRIVACFCVTLIGTFLLALPLAFLDYWWVRLLRYLTASLKSRLKFVMRKRPANYKVFALIPTRGDTPDLP